MTLRGYLFILKRDSTSGSICDWHADKCIFGRDSSCDVHIKLDDVAPIHCKLQAIDDGRVFVEHLARQTSKTLLNGAQVSERTFVPHNSLLSISDRNFRFLYPENSVWIIKPPSVLPRKISVLESPIQSKSPMPVADVSDSNSQSPLSSIRKTQTPILSSPRRALSTKERYGPTPPRPITPSPSVDVKRHATPVGQSSQPVRKKAKVNVISETPSASGTLYINRLPSPKMRADASQVNNSSSLSYYSINTPNPSYSEEHSHQIDLFDGSYDEHLDPSVTLLLSASAKSTALTNSEHVLTEPRKANARMRSVLRRKSLPPRRSPLSLGYGGLPHKNDHIAGTRATGLGSATPVVVVNCSEVAVKHGIPQTPTAEQSQLDVTSPVQFGRGCDSSMSPSKHTVDQHRFRRGVKFGPRLSPEQFDYRLPPSTPLRRGALPPSSQGRTTRASIIKQSKVVAESPVEFVSFQNDKSHTPTKQPLAELGPRSSYSKPSNKILEASTPKSVAIKRRLSKSPGFAHDDALNASTAATIGSSFHSSNLKQPRVSSPQVVGSVKAPVSPTCSIMENLFDAPASVSLETTLPSSQTSGRGRPSSKHSQSELSADRQTKESSLGRVSTKSWRSTSPRRAQLVHRILRPSIHHTPTVTDQVPKTSLSYSDTFGAINATPIRSAKKILPRSVETVCESSGVRLGDNHISPNPHETPSGWTASEQITAVIRIRRKCQSLEPPTSRSCVTEVPQMWSFSATKSSISAPHPRTSKGSGGCNSAYSILSSPGITEKPVVRYNGSRSPTSSQKFAVSKTLKTPKILPSRRLLGVRALFKTPKSMSSPDLLGVRKLMLTPKKKRSPNLEGVRYLLREVRSPGTPRISGIKQLMKTPRKVASPRLSGISGLFASPDSAQQPRRVQSRSKAIVVSGQSNKKTRSVRGNRRNPTALAAPAPTRTVKSRCEVKPVSPMPENDHVKKSALDGRVSRRQNSPELLEATGGTGVAVKSCGRQKGAKSTRLFAADQSSPNMVVDTVVPPRVTRSKACEVVGAKTPTRKGGVTFGEEKSVVKTSRGGNQTRRRAVVVMVRQTTSVENSGKSRLSSEQIKTSRGRKGGREAPEVSQKTPLASRRTRRAQPKPEDETRVSTIPAIHGTPTRKRGSVGIRTSLVKMAPVNRPRRTRGAASAAVDESGDVGLSCAGEGVVIKTSRGKASVRSVVPRKRVVEKATMPGGVAIASPQAKRTTRRTAQRRKTESVVSDQPRRTRSRK